MLACEMATVAWAREREQAGVELEADQEHVEDDADLGDDAEIRADFAWAARSSSPRARSNPSSDGPSMMPATISPITRGWPKWTNSLPSQRPKSRIATERTEHMQQDVGLGGDARAARGRSVAAATGVSRSP